MQFGLLLVHGLSQQVLENAGGRPGHLKLCAKPHTLRLDTITGAVRKRMTPHGTLNGQYVVRRPQPPRNGLHITVAPVPR